MADILSFPGVTVPSDDTRQVPEHQTAIVDALKEALALAESGKLKALAMCWVNDALACAEGWVCGPQSNHVLMGSIACLQVRYATEQLRRSQPEDMPPTDLPTVS